MRSINFGVIVRILFVLLAVVGLFMLVPAALAFAGGDNDLARAFWLPALCVLVPGIPFGLLFKTRHAYLGAREGFLMVSIGWILVSALGALPFILSGATDNFANAYFESMSGFTTTGASIFSDVEALSPPILLWRSLTHWLGGMGVIALTIAILPVLGISGLNLMRAETPGPDVDKITPKLTHTAKILWLIYSGLTAFNVVLLLIGGMSLFDAINHAMATMATGGFSTKNNSLAFWHSSWIDWVTTIFMVLAGANFVLYFQILSGKFQSAFRNSEARAYILIFAIVSLVGALGLLFSKTYPNFAISLEHSAFQVASIMTTTGFATVDFALWPSMAQMVLIFVMFIGGSTGSTAGGIKVLRCLVMLKLARHEARMSLHPHAVFTMQLNGRPFNKSLVYPIAGFVFTYILIVLLGTFVVSLEGHDFLSSLTATLSTLGNIGPGLAKVGPMSNFGFFSDSLKLFFSFLMLLGRLELWTVLVLFMPRFWRR